MSDVACNGCRTCCIDQSVILMPDDEANLSAYQYSELTAGDVTVKVLRHKPNGECVHLSDAGCTIYDKRPEVCRAYDCRKQFLIMTRNERRQFKNATIWIEARKRLDTLDADDRAELATYRERASAGFSRIAGEQST